MLFVIKTTSKPTNESISLSLSSLIQLRETSVPCGKFLLRVNSYFVIWTSLSYRHTELNFHCSVEREIWKWVVGVPFRKWREIRIEKGHMENYTFAWRSNSMYRETNECYADNLLFHHAKILNSRASVVPKRVSMLHFEHYANGTTQSTSVVWQIVVTQFKYGQLLRNADLANGANCINGRRRERH